MDAENQPLMANNPNFDDKPIGKSSNFDIPMFAQNEDFSITQIKAPQPAPLSKRLSSNIWKIRKEAFQQLINEVNIDPTFYKEFENRTLDFITFSNSQIMERALKVLLIYLCNNGVMSIEPKTIIKTILEKCLIVSKEQVKENSENIIFWYIDNGFQSILMHQLNEELLTKNPKILAVTVNMITTLLNVYGVKRMKSLQKFEKYLGFFSEGSKPQGKLPLVQLYKEMFKWTGDAVFTSFKIHPDVKDLVIKFSKQYDLVPMQIKRGHKNDFKQGKKLMINPTQKQQASSQPIDVLGHFNARWVDEVLQMEKWKEKKYELEQFIKKINVPCILPRQVNHFINLLKRLLADNNINLLLCSFSIIQNLSKGLKKSFTHVGKNVQSLVFSKLRDSKNSIVQTTHVTLKSMLHSLSFDDFMDDIKEGLEDKAYNMRLQVIKFLANFVGKKDQRTQQCLKGLLDKICKLTQDGNSQVRNLALEFLCKIKENYQMKFFGDKLKRLNEKKIKTIQSVQSIATNNTQEMMDIEDNVTSIQVIQEKKNQPNHRVKSPIKYLKKGKSSLSEELVETNPDVKFNPIVNNVINDLCSPHESARLSAYQTIHIKHQNSEELFRKMKNKAVRQSSASLLKIILQIVKKETEVGVEVIQFLSIHDWKKMRSGINEFINSSRFTHAAEEFMKHNPLISNVQKIIQPNNSCISLKTFTLELQNLMPKISSPSRQLKMDSALNLLRILEQIQKVSSDSDLNPTTGWNQQLINQFFNVLKYRLSEDPEMVRQYCKVLSLMNNKGLICKTKGSRLLIPTLIHKVRDESIKKILHQLLASSPTFVLTFLPTQLLNEHITETLIEFVTQSNEIFVKYADLKNFIVPLLHVLFKLNLNSISQKCQQFSEKILDQIVELCGEKVLQQQVKRAQISKVVEKYLIKYNIKINQREQLHIHVKNDRIKMDLDDSWPIQPSPAHILNLVNMMSSFRDPLPKLATLYPLSSYQFNILYNLDTVFIIDTSDILLKWTYWRLNLEVPDYLFELVTFATKVLETINFNIHELEMASYLSCLITYFKRMKAQKLIGIAEMLNKLFVFIQDFKQNSFRFWINSLIETIVNPPVDQILKIMVMCYSEMIGAEIVTLARIPAVLNNVDFTNYLKSKYDSQYLIVSGFKIQKPQLKEQKNQQKLLSELGGPENTIQITTIQKSQIINIFQKSSSTQLQSQLDQLEQKTSEKGFELHLKIMYSIIAPFMKRDIPYINIYTYFKELQKILSGQMKKSSQKPFLMGLFRILLYFLVDLDENQIENKQQIVRTVNKILLNLLDTSESRHMLEIFFILLKNQLKVNLSNKILHLLSKCIGKTAKNQTFSSKASQNIIFILSQFNQLMTEYGIFLDHPIIKSVRIMFGDIVSNHQEIARKTFSEMLLLEGLNESLKKIMIQELQEEHKQLQTSSQKSLGQRSIKENHNASNIVKNMNVNENCLPTFKKMN